MTIVDNINNIDLLCSTLILSKKRRANEKAIEERRKEQGEADENMSDA
jgi:hypothetical protein